MVTGARSMSFVKRHLAELVAEVQRGGGPIIVTRRGKSVAVIESVASYERTRQALLMMKLVSMGEQDIPRGRTYTQNEVFAAARRRLASLPRVR